MAGKLKGLDFKKLALKHGEKAVLAVVGLLVLFTLMGSKWIPYTRYHHPLEITNAVDSAEHELSKKTWPVEEQQQFVVPEEKQVQNLVALIREPVDSSPYEFSQTFRFDLYGTTTPLTDPELNRVDALIAAAGRAPILVNPNPLHTDWFAEDTDMEEGQDAADTAADPESDIPPEFRSPTSGLTLPGAVTGRGQQLPGGGILLPGGDTVPGGDRRQAASAQSRRRGSRRRSSNDRSGAGGNLADANLASLLSSSGADAGSLLGFGRNEDEEYGFSGGYGMGGMGGEARGVRFVAVRGVVPLRSQIKKYQKAANVSFLEAEQLYQIIDFELQRKKMLEGAEDPWSGDWETVDIEVSKEVLREAADFAPEPLEGVVHDSTITMPLPARPQGIWHDFATHPKLKEFELSEEEMELEQKFHEKLLEQQLKIQESMPEELVVKKGFSDLVHDGRTLSTSLRGVGVGAGAGLGRNQQISRGGDFEEEDYSGSGLGVGGLGAAGLAGLAGLAGQRGFGVAGTFRQGLDADKFMKDLEKAETKDEKSKVLRKYVEKQVKEMGAGGEMLLFRYLDFDVEPGATYKYRVRLIVTNPNYGRRSSEAAGLTHVVEGQTRTTEWSDITEPARVPDDMDYFVKNITRSRGTDRWVANWTLFQWDPEFGTTVAKQDIDVELGQEIGGPSKPFVLDPALPRFEIEDYVFQSGDVFVDAKQYDSIDPGDHPDLKLSPSSKRRDLRVSDQALILRSNGNLKVIDQMSRTGMLRNRAQELGHEQKLFADIKGAEAQQMQTSVQGGALTGADFEDFVGSAMGGGQTMDDMAEAFRGRGQGRNSLRKGGRAGLGGGRGGGDSR
ncbi:MAG: hypothetical protein AB7U20_05815 [Planctomycetaceae bacterium]